MSGLETAIRNALEKSDRTNPEIRARIYQSARQALESGLSKQGVTDSQVIAAQRQRLELKIREIEGEERSRVPAGSSAPQPVAAKPLASPPTQIPQPHPQPEAAHADGFLLGGAVREDRPTDPSRDAFNLDLLRVERDNAPTEDAPPVGAPAAGRAIGKRRRERDSTVLDAPAKRSAKPRRRRGFLSMLLSLLVFFGAIGAAAWWAYSSGLIQRSMEQAIKVANQSSRNQQNGQGLGPQVGFSEEWVAVFNGTNTQAVTASGSARLESADAASGPALRLTSTAGAAGDIAVTVPADILRQLAGKTSTIALTVQSGTDDAVEFSVSCDFGGLGKCSRHRFTAQQEKADALFRVTFDQSNAPEASGRLLLSTSIAGADNQILLYAVRVLPGQ